MPTLAILPIKRFERAKQRLGPALVEDPSRGGGLRGGARRALAEAMFTDVLTALRRTPGIEQALVVTGERAAQEIARGHGALVVDDPREESHSAAAVLGVREAVRRGYERVLLVPGDCPALDPAELGALLAARSPESEVVVVPDRHGTGTNALLLSPPDVIEPAFGPGSRDRHVGLAEAAGVAVRVAEMPTLGLDVDTAEDLDALRDMLAQARGGAAHTRGMLSQLGRATA
jgi:2-phospho-L-lactate guanylyltransferase